VWQRPCDVFARYAKAPSAPLLTGLDPQT
jgi:hypothetical protein